MSRCFVLILAVLASGCATYHKGLEPSASDRLYPVNGHKMHLMVEGSGPSVILSGGGGVNDPSAGFQPLISKLKGVATVGVYERAGYGLSEETKVPRTVDTVVRELDELFSQAGLKAPFVLVGHSMASLELLRYAQTFPTKVKAVVLLEGAPPKYYLTMKMPSDFEQWVYTNVFGLAKGNALEVKSVVENAKAVLAGGSLGDIPLSYFYAGSNGIEGWADAQKGLSEFSNRAEALLIPDANHFIYQKNAEAIAAKVEELL